MDEAQQATIANEDDAATLQKLRPQPSSPQTIEFALISTASSSGSESVPVIRTSSNPPSNTPVNASVSTTSIQTQWTGDHRNLEILSRLGEDCGSAVCKVRDLRTPSLIMAQKTILATNPKALSHEYRKWSGSRHMNITTFYGAFVESFDGELSASRFGAPRICVLMEYCEGGSLDGVSRRIRQMGFGFVSEKVMGKIAHGILLGLDYLHSVQVIHRDIKPSNVLLTRAGLIKLHNFCFSEKLVELSAKPVTGWTYYIAPERIEGRPYTISSDVWSTGLTLLEFAQHKFPYPLDLGPIDLLQAIVRGPEPELSDDAEGGGVWSTTMKDFIKNCLTTDAGARPTPSEMLKHPWIIEQQAKRVAMDKWVAQVWGWELPATSSSLLLSSTKNMKEKERRRKEHGQSGKTSLNNDHAHTNPAGDLTNLNVVPGPFGDTSSTP